MMRLEAGNHYVCFLLQCSLVPKCSRFVDKVWVYSVDEEMIKCKYTQDAMTSETSVTKEVVIVLMINNLHLQLTFAFGQFG